METKFWKQRGDKMELIKTVPNEDYADCVALLLSDEVEAFGHYPVVIVTDMEPVTGFPIGEDGNTSTRAGQRFDSALAASQFSGFVSNVVGERMVRDFSTPQERQEMLDYWKKNPRAKTDCSHRRGCLAERIR